MKPKLFILLTDDILKILQWVEEDVLKFSRFRIFSKMFENPIDMSVVSNDLIFVWILFDHFYFLFKNDTLLQSMSEHEYLAYMWNPLIRNAFLGKDDLKLSCGELASKSYEKLKEILNVARWKGFLRSLGTEIIAQEDGVINTFIKGMGISKNWSTVLKLFSQLTFTEQHSTIP